MQSYSAEPELTTSNPSCWQHWQVGATRVVVAVGADIPAIGTGGDTAAVAVHSGTPRTEGQGRRWDRFLLLKGDALSSDAEMTTTFKMKDWQI